MKCERGEYPDVYQYDDLPQPLRVQLVHLWNEYLGGIHRQHRNIPSIVNNLCEDCCKILCRELGIFELTNKNKGGWGYEANYFNEIVDFFLSEKDFDIAMSVVELMARPILAYLKYRGKDVEYFNKFLNELNQRFREHGLGYELYNLKIIKVNSQLIHKEVVLPTLGFLSQSIYKGANEDFLNAHEHYRHQRYADCLKAYESTLKIILTKRNWAFDKNATLNQLVKIALDNELIPSFWLNNFNNLNGLLTSGINVGRNKLSGHGQGNQRNEIPEYLVAYMLHMTASTILFLVKADEDFGSRNEVGV